MAKHSFIEWKPRGQERVNILSRSIEIIEDYETKGYDLSLRQLYYQLVSKNVIPNNKDEYRKLGDLIKHGRRAGYIDWDMIVDRGRTLDSSPHWESAADVMKTASDIFRLDRWEDQETRLYIMVEKAALIGILWPVCRKYDVPFTALRGYSSESHLYKIARQIRSYIENGQHVKILYLGDHDPSGLDMDRDIEERLRLLGSLGGVDLSRLALTFEQIEELNPPPNYAKVTDSRSKTYIPLYGDKSWELDAVEPSYLAALVENHIKENLDEDLYDQRIALEEMIKEEIEQLADDLGEE